MKIGSDAGIMLGKSRMLRKAKMRAANGGRTNTSGRLSGNGRTSGVNDAMRSMLGTGSYGINDTISALQARSNYTVIQRSAESIQRYGKDLLDTDKDALFGLAIPNLDDAGEDGEEVKQPTAEELAEYKQDVVDAITCFVDDYNTMVERMNQVEDTTQQWYLKELGSYVKANRSKLSSLGITMTSDGKLKLDESTLENADVTRMKELFGEKGSFGDKVTKLASAIGSAAEAGAAKALNSGYLPSTNYNRYGMGYDNSAYGGGSWRA